MGSLFKSVYLHVCVCAGGSDLPCSSSAGPTALALGSVWSLRAKAELSETGSQIDDTTVQTTEQNESEDHGYNREELSKPRRDAEFFTCKYSDANRELLSAGDVSADDEMTAALPICCSMSCKPSGL